MGNNKLKTPTGTLSFTNEKFLKLMNLLNDKSGSTSHANVAGASYHFGLPSLVLNVKSPFSLVYGKEPNLSHLKSFGCLCFAVVVKGSDKFSERSKKYVLVGYGRLHHLEQGSILEQPRNDEDNSATPLDENNNSEGNVGLTDEVHVLYSKYLPHWNSKRQATLSKSSAEAEYRCMTSTTCEIMWVVKVLQDFGLNNLIPANLYCDNKSTIQIAANPIMHEKTKHLNNIMCTY
ncbi:ribonuclease H-like domain-containing protein [Tanacetum coccineum]